MVLAGKTFVEKNITVPASSSSLDATVGQQLFGHTFGSAEHRCTAPIDENDVHYQTGYNLYDAVFK